MDITCKNYDIGLPRPRIYRTNTRTRLLEGKDRFLIVALTWKNRSPCKQWRQCTKNITSKIYYSIYIVVDRLWYYAKLNVHIDPWCQPAERLAPFTHYLKQINISPLVQMKTLKVLGVFTSVYNNWTILIHYVNNQSLSNQVNLRSELKVIEVLVTPRV